MKYASVLLASFPLLMLACGGSVSGGGGTAGSGGTGSSTTTSSGSTTTSSSTTSSGTGGSTSSSSTSSSSSTTSSTSGSTSSSTTSSSTGGTGCVGSVDLTVAGQAVHLGTNCASDGYDPSNSMTPSGYLLEGGAPPGASTLMTYGCVSETAGAQGLALSVPNVKAAGTFTTGTLTYTDANGKVWSNSGGFSVTVTTLGAEGDTIVGTVSSGIISPPSQVALQLTGSFTVCHTADELTP